MDCIIGSSNTWTAFRVKKALFWLLEYVGELARVDDEQMASMEAWAKWIGAARRSTVANGQDGGGGLVGGDWRRRDSGGVGEGGGGVGGVGEGGGGGEGWGGGGGSGGGGGGG